MADINERPEKARLIEANMITIKVRWFYYLFVGSTGLLTKLFAEMNPNVNFSPKTMVALLVFGLGLNVFYYFFFKLNKNPSLRLIKIISVLQVSIDPIVNTVIIFNAGGIISISFLYYTYFIAISAFLFSYIGVLGVVFFCSLLYSGLIFGQYFDIIPYISRYGHEFEEMLSQNISAVVVNTSTVFGSFLIIGTLVSMMARNLKEKQAEIDIELAKEKAILDNFLDGLVYVNNKGIIDIINPAAEKIFDVRASELSGKEISKLDYGHRPALQQILETDPDRSLDFSPAGKPDIFLNVSVFTVRDGNNSNLGNVYLVHDKSREKFIDKMKSEFITIASHQLRTPLSAIKGAVHLLKNGDMGPINKEQEKILHHTYEYTENLIKIFNDLLNVSSIEEGKFSYAYEETNIHNFVMDITEKFWSEAKSRNIKIETSILDDTQSAMIDTQKMRLALGSIIKNAIIYSRDGGTVKVTVMFENSNVNISVSDTGIGIPKYLHEKVFSKFFRADNAIKFNTEGNGLDLFVAKNVLENHRGSIWFESVVDKGSIFYVKFPTER